MKASLSGFIGERRFEEKVKVSWEKRIEGFCLTLKWEDFHGGGEVHLTLNLETENQLREFLERRKL